MDREKVKKGPSAWYLRGVVNVFLMFSSLVFLFVSTEVVLTMFFPKPIVWLDPQESYVHHPQLSHTLKANQKAFTHSLPLTTNSYGLRDDEFPMKPTPGTFRVLCLGDSLTFGVGVKAQDTYPKQLESLLNSDGSKQFEVINGGVPAYDTWQEVAYLREYGWQFEPDLVIVGVYTNDIVPKPEVIPHLVNESGFEKKRGVSGLVPYPVIHLLKRSRILLLLRDRYDRLVNLVGPSPEYSHMLSVLQGTADPFVERGWAEVETSFKEMLSLGKKHGFGLLLVIFPMSDQLLRDYPSASYPAKVKELARKHGIQFIDLMPAFSEKFRGFGSLFIEWDGHPNAHAYRIAAKATKLHLVSHHLVPLVQINLNSLLLVLNEQEPAG